MSKCAMCGRIVEGRYVCKSCEKKVKGNLSAEDNPCFQCDRRKGNCHTYCRDYIEWVKNRNAVKDIVYRQRRSENDVFMSGIGREKRR